MTTAVLRQSGLRISALICRTVSSRRNTRRWNGEVDLSTRQSGTLHGTIDLWRRELVVPSDDDGDVLVVGEDLRCGADDLEVT